MSEPEESREKAPKTDAVLFKGDEKDLEAIKRQEEDELKENARRDRDDDRRRD